MKGFKKVRAYVRGLGVVTTDIGIQEGRIVLLGEGEVEPIDLLSSLPHDAIVLPGFVDEHIHGAGGADAMDATQEALETIWLWTTSREYINCGKGGNNRFSCHNHDTKL